MTYRSRGRSLIEVILVSFCLCWIVVVLSLLLFSLNPFCLLNIMVLFFEIHRPLVLFYSSWGLSPYCVLAIIFGPSGRKNGNDNGDWPNWRDNIQIIMGTQEIMRLHSLLNQAYKPSVNWIPCELREREKRMERWEPLYDARHHLRGVEPVCRLVSTSANNLLRYGRDKITICRRSKFAHTHTSSSYKQIYDMIDFNDLVSSTRVSLGRNHQSRQMFRRCAFRWPCCWDIRGVLLFHHARLEEFHASILWRTSITIILRLAHSRL